ncbi:LOW QUALITY PROTEIN: T-cell activation Rho GTPase-activating protein-like [Gymnogyps californianus]|uniref:LOW QUALITY PROTEIN: T-cell activation Rho GTPase-activating protein-like n=1 Tax=Gymnogyps californianus TaxID=33616 RepID=UPI0021C8A9DF|nr:LOW QUALITY PROTEIN: T-cell activation Rho GTPase-activating protein-like [Gymnogyps californianus]
MGQVNCCRGSSSRALKELWVSALLGPPEGVEGARVTQLPSIKLLLKELSSRHAATTLHASSLERLVESQAKQAGPSRRRGLPWCFAWRGTSAAAEAPGLSGSGSRGALFGRPLAALCSQDGTLPQPIQDLLALLHEHGPSTEGIFRLAASERASRELREALDSGAEVHLESQPAHLLAVILKDFLRKIPSKLLQAELYEEWMNALQKTSRQERLAGLKEVASKLPKGNLLLLKSLLSLLQDISRNAATSRMTAGNLAVCVGPNLLSPAEEHTLPLDVLLQVTGKVPPVALESKHLKARWGEGNMS